jgi:hypothetical protein
MLGLALYSCQQVWIYDTGLYHAGMIEWLSRFGTVKGIALLHDRFGFTSSWFSLAAAFNTGPWTGVVSPLIGGYALLLGSAHFVISLARLVDGRGRASDWFAATAYLLVLTWMLRVGISTSPSPDVPVIFLTVLVAWTMLVICEGAPSPVGIGTPLSRAVPLVLSAAAFSLKLSALPLVVCALLFYLRGAKSRWQFGGLLGLSALFAVPTILADLTSSGCPLFPSSLLCTHLPWSVGSAAAAQTEGIGRDFLRWAGAAPPGANSVNWVVHWIHGELLGALLIGTSLICSAVLVFLTSGDRNAPVGWLLLLSLTGIGYVMAFSPAPRFLLGYAAIPPAWLAAVVCTRWGLHPVMLIPPMLVALASVRRIVSPGLELSDFTPSALRYTLIAPAAAVSLGLGIITRAVFRRSVYAALPLGKMAYPVLGTLVALFFGTANFSVFASTLPLPEALSRADYGSVVLRPPPLRTLAAAEQTRHRVNDVDYISPPNGAFQCWAVIPCTPWPVPSSLHLLDPKHGIAGGLARG